MNHGRPLRFLALTMGGWTVVRVALLWPTIDSVPALIRAIAPPVAAATRPDLIARAVTPRTSSRMGGIAPPPPLAATPAPALRQPDPTRIALALAAMIRFGEAVPIDPPPRPVQPPPLRPAPLATPPHRLAGSIWGIVRGGTSGTLPGGQLGGSQVGARVTYVLGTSRRVALAARVSAPLHGRGAEAGVGLDWQPTALPLHVIAEQRIAIDGGRGGPTLMVVGGLDPQPLPAGFNLEAYGQAGAIVRGSVDGFADGAARVTRPVARVGGLRLDLGVGAWGGAQRGAARLDFGPSLAVSVPLDRRIVRITLDWRQRVAGHARPGSGPALSIGGDF
jgi:hypothetical protein